MLELAPLLKAVILGIVEGLTEFLPISSTGHLILAGELLDFNDDKGKAFLIVIQIGAMFAVMWQYRVRFWGLTIGLFSRRADQVFVAKLFVAFLPAAIVGLLFSNAIKAHLFGAVPVALALIAGAIVILIVERFYKSWRIDSIDQMSWRDAFLIGLAQCCSLVPGVSRAGATIIGGMLCGLSRSAATEFSFFLAVPTLIAAGGYDLVKHREEFAAGDAAVLAVGLIVSFIAALICVRWLLRFIASHNFKIFAWYRIVLGIIILAVMWQR
jgi:undecaprenyl-diphosphatase